MRTVSRTVWIAAVALVASGCSTTSDSPAASPSPSTPSSVAAGPSLVVTSTDFADGAALPESAKADAFGGQCNGENISPSLAWSGAPDGTAAYAITLIDIDASSFVHWTKADIPADVTEIPTGGADALAGVGGQTGNSSGTYFGPCPPGAEHRYVFTVYALDAPLGLDANFGIVDLNLGLKGHVLAEATLTGLAGNTP